MIAQTFGASEFNRERVYQITKHGFTTEWQRENMQYYEKGQLLYASRQLSNIDPNLISSVPPENWDNNWWIKLTKKAFKDRLRISGAFLAAHFEIEFE